MSKTKPRILMTHSESSAVGLYRVWNPAKYLKLAGWDVVTLPEVLPDNVPIEPGPGGKSWVEYSEGVDLIVIQRSDHAEFIALALAMGEMNNCPLVFEIDDDIYDVSRNSPAYEYWYPASKGVERSPLFDVVELFIQQVNAVTTTTNALASVYAKHNPNTYVLPNAQDPDAWEGLERAHNEHITIGWAGGFTHYDDLHMIRRPLKRILKKYPDVRFRIVGLNPDFLAGHPQVEYISKFAPTREYPKFLASLGFDIGLVPVVERPFNRGKSNIKWQEYSMLGIPTIASKVGEYLEIEQEVTGLLAGSEAEWEFRMEQLIKDESLRKTLGANAKRYTLEHSNIAVNIKQYDSVYRKIIADYKEQ